MDITPIVSTKEYVINGYGDGYFLVKNTRVYDDIIICSEKYLKYSKENLKNLIQDYQPEVVLIGGRKKESLGVPISCETMTADAACRTYNILLSEKRRVVAVLFRK